MLMPLTEDVGNLEIRHGSRTTSAIPSPSNPPSLTDNHLANMRRFPRRACPRALDVDGTPDMRVVARIAWDRTPNDPLATTNLTKEIVNDGYLRSYGTHVLTCPRHAVSSTATPPFTLDGVGPNWAFVASEIGLFRLYKQDFSVALLATRNAWRDLTPWTKLMTEHTPQPPKEQGYLLYKYEFDELNIVRDTLMLLAQLAGPSHTPRSDFVNLVIPRAFLGQYFADLAHRMGDILEMVARTETCASDAEVPCPTPESCVCTR